MPGRDGYYKVQNTEALLALPKFNWDQLYNLPGVKERVDAAKSSSKSKKKKKVAICDDTAASSGAPPVLPEDMEIFEC